jgi:HK97 family phage portal protein
VLIDFCLIFVPFGHYDEPEILRYAITSICPKGADVRHANRLNIGGFLIHPGKLSEEAQKNLVQKLMERLAGVANAHRPMVLQEGMKFERASDTAKDSQLLEARKWQTTLIAQRFRVPLHMLGIDDQTNRSTVEAQVTSPHCVVRFEC